jgi:hypothetical protein
MVEAASIRKIGSKAESKKKKKKRKHQEDDKEVEEPKNKSYDNKRTNPLLLLLLLLLVVHYDSFFQIQSLVIPDVNGVHRSDTFDRWKKSRKWPSKKNRSSSE